jgi:hypothetical protein
MAIITDFVLDTALNVIRTQTTNLHITSAEATSFANVSALTLGNTSTFSASAPTTTENAREITIAPISDGAVTGTGTATHYAIVDADNSRLFATGALAQTQVVTQGNIFSLGSFEIGIEPKAD